MSSGEYYRSCPLPKPSGARLRPASKMRTTKRNKRRELREHQFGPGRERDVIVMFPCSACGQHPPSEPSHVKTRGAGGYHADMVPHCNYCHKQFHKRGRDTFAETMGQDLEEDAARYAILVEILLAGGVFDRPGVAVDDLLATLRFGPPVGWDRRDERWRLMGDVLLGSDL